MKLHLPLIASLCLFGWLCPLSVPTLTAATDKAKEAPKNADDKKPEPDKKSKPPEFDPTQPDGILKWLLEQQKKGGDAGNQEIFKLLEKERERVREFENKERVRIEKQIDELKKQLDEERKKSLKKEEDDLKRIRELEKVQQESERVRVEKQLDEFKANLLKMEKSLEAERKKTAQAEELSRANALKIQEEARKLIEEEKKRSLKLEEEERKRIRELEKQNQDNERLHIKEQLDELKASLKKMEKSLDEKDKRLLQAEDVYKAKVQKIQEEFKSSSPDENRRLKEQLEQERLRLKKLEEYLSYAERAAKSVVVRGRVIQQGKPGVALVEFRPVEGGGGLERLPEPKAKTKQPGFIDYLMGAPAGAPGSRAGDYKIITEKELFSVGGVMFQVEEMDSAEIRLRVKAPTPQLILR